MVLKIATITLLLMCIESQGYGLDDPIKSGCVFHYFGEDYPTTSIQGNVAASTIRGRDCVIVFRDLPRGKLRLSFKQSKIVKSKNQRKKEKENPEEIEQSCGTSFVKIYQVDSSSDSHEEDGSLPEKNMRRKKIGHFCNSMLNDREVMFDFQDRLEIILIQCKFDLLFNFSSTEALDYKANAYVPPRWIDDTNKSSKRDQSSSKPLFLEKGECERLLKFPCKHSVVCGVASSKFLCNQTKHLCIDRDEVCNGEQDCLEGDNSDESRCSFPLIKNVSFVLMIVGISSASTVCCLNHKASLRKNNVVRYKGDVIKRKDIIKAKKQGGFATADKSSALERKISLQLTNPSVTPVDTEERPVQLSPKVASNHSSHLDDKIQLTKLSVNNLAKADSSNNKVTDNGIYTHPKILYDYSFTDEEDMMDGKYLSGSGGGYGYRFEYQNCL